MGQASENGEKVGSWVKPNTIVLFNRRLHCALLDAVAVKLRIKKANL